MEEKLAGEKWVELERGDTTELATEARGGLEVLAAGGREGLAAVALLHCRCCHGWAREKETWWRVNPVVEEEMGLSRAPGRRSGLVLGCCCCAGCARNEEEGALDGGAGVLPSERGRRLWWVKEDHEDSLEFEGD